MADETGSRVRKVLAGARSEILDVIGAGLLVVATFTWSMTGGLVAAGVGVLAFNWRLNGGPGE